MSFTSLILLILTIAFILPRLIYPPAGYAQFLLLPTQMSKWVLDIELIKSNKLYFFEVVTALFLHQSYLHFIGNIMFAIFVMYELEYCWKPSLLLGLLAGLSAHFIAIIVEEGRYVGFSGVLAGYFAIYVSALIINCPYLQRVYPQQFCFTVVIAAMMSIMVIGSGKGALVHLFGYLCGMIYGAAFYPTNSESVLSPYVAHILKVVAIGLFVILGILAFIV